MAERLYLAELVRMQHAERMAAASRSAEPSVSVEFDTTAKGDGKATVKIYAPFGYDLDELEEYAQAVAQVAGRTYDAARVFTQAVPV